MIDPIVYHPDLSDRGLREFRIWPYLCNCDRTKKHRRSGRWGSRTTEGL